MTIDKFGRHIMNHRVHNYYELEETVNNIVENKLKGLFYHTLVSIQSSILKVEGALTKYELLNKQMYYKFDMQYATIVSVSVQPPREVIVYINEKGYVSSEINNLLIKCGDHISFSEKDNSSNTFLCLQLVLRVPIIFQDLSDINSKNSHTS